MSEDHTVVMHVRMPRSLYARLEDYWHDRRLPSRSVGVRLLVEQALDAEPQDAPPQPRKREAKR